MADGLQPGQTKIFTWKNLPPSQSPITTARILLPHLCVLWAHCWLDPPSTAVYALKSQCWSDSAADVWYRPGYKISTSIKKKRISQSPIKTILRGRQSDNWLLKGPIHKANGLQPGQTKCLHQRKKNSTTPIKTVLRGRQSDNWLLIKAHPKRRMVYSQAKLNIYLKIILHPSQSPITTKIFVWITATSFSSHSLFT